MTYTKVYSPWNYAYFTESTFPRQSFALKDSFRKRCLKAESRSKLDQLKVWTFEAFHLKFVAEFELSLQKW